MNTNSPTTCDKHEIFQNSKILPTSLQILRQLLKNNCNNFAKSTNNLLTRNLKTLSEYEYHLRRIEELLVQLQNETPDSEKQNLFFPSSNSELHASYQNLSEVENPFSELGASYSVTEKSSKSCKTCTNAKSSTNSTTMCREDTRFNFPCKITSCICGKKNEKKTSKESRSSQTFSAFSIEEQIPESSSNKNSFNTFSQSETDSETNFGKTSSLSRKCTENLNRTPINIQLSMNAAGDSKSPLTFVVEVPSNVLEVLQKKGSEIIESESTVKKPRSLTPKNNRLKSVFLKLLRNKTKNNSSTSSLESTSFTKSGRYFSDIKNQENPVRDASSCNSSPVLSDFSQINIIHRTSGVLNTDFCNSDTDGVSESRNPESRNKIGNPKEEVSTLEELYRNFLENRIRKEWENELNCKERNAKERKNSEFPIEVKIRKIPLVLRKSSHSNKMKTNLQNEEFLKILGRILPGEPSLDKTENKTSIKNKKNFGYKTSFLKSEKSYSDIKTSTLEYVMQNLTDVREKKDINLRLPAEKDWHQTLSTRQLSKISLCSSENCSCSVKDEYDDGIIEMTEDDKNEKVNAEGHVLKVNPQDLSVVQTIILKDDVKFCSHGYKQENEITKVKAIAVNDDSVLFATESGQLWASGSHPEIDIDSVEPKKVIFFEGRVVFDLACGFNFHAVIVRKINRTLKEDTDSENELDEQVFVKSCPQCLSNVRVSPVSIASSDTYPMGLHVQHFSDRSSNSLSAFSSASKDDVLICSLNNENAANSHEPLVNGQESASEISESEKKNTMFINTEAAKQFLTRQLSWVSSYGSGKDEVQVDAADNPTNLIKQNVSNMANLVYEGVKTVGDKVATLSRHVSGSSDVNDHQEGIDNDHRVEENKRTQGSLIHSLRCEEFPWSSSAGSSEHELSQQGLNERINLLVREGNNLLSTELWTWGDVKHGQLGTGDTVRRPRPVLVAKLSQVGVQKVSCGSFHTVAMTLDGRVFTWGRNNCKQATDEFNSCQSAPKMFTTSKVRKSGVYIGNERTKDAAAGTEHTFILMQPALLVFLGRFNYAFGGEIKSESSTESCGSFDASTMIDFSSNSLGRVLCSGPYSCCTSISPSANEISEDYINEQIFLEEIISFYQNFIRPFQKKGAATQESNVYETLCRCYTELMNITALNVQSLSDYYNHIGKSYEVTIIANIEECIAAYKYYLNAICDVISLGGFTHIARIIELPQTVSKKGQDSKALEARKANNENIIASALQHPLRSLSRYKTMINNLIKCNGSKMGIERLKEGLSKWERIIDEQEKRQKEAEATKQFWEGSGKLIELLRSPERRLIRESRSHPISVLNSGRFTTHWFVLLTDIFIHITGSSYVVYPLPTLWVEPLQDSETLQNALSVTTPECNLTIYAPSAVERSEWLQSLHAAIKCSLPRVIGHKPPMARNSSFTFTKHPIYKDAKYTGRWFNGKPDTDDSYGQMEWPDGRMYKGQFSKGVIQGYGTMHNLTQGIYQGQWKDGQQNGYGIMKYTNGDVYEGYFKDGVPHGHGTKKEGHFMASAASVYIGEWVSGVKQGYGIMDDIKTGEKYIGSWSNNTKHGCGLIVTLDGIYYEGVFMQDILTGHGVMVFEDGTNYEGEFKSAGIFCGKGTLTFFSGDKLEGNLSGAWDEGIKVNATLHIKKANDNSHNLPKPTCFGKLFSPPELPKSFGKLCVPPDQKWRAIFRQLYQQLDVPEPGSKFNLSVDKASETQKLWDNAAVIISNSYHKKTKSSKNMKDSSKVEKDMETIDTLSKIPYFGRDKLTLPIYEQIHQYLTIAFESGHHPLGKLLTELTTVYTATYGGVRVHPLLKSHAVSELRSLTTRIYEVVTLFFPALPVSGEECLSEIEKAEESKDFSSGGELEKEEYFSKSQEAEERKVRIDAALLHPVLLPKVHSALFVLYALDNKKDDDSYWKRLIKWNKQPDSTLTSFLGIDQVFGGSNSVEQGSEEPLFSKAIETLQQLKTTFTPLEKLKVVHNTVKQVEQVAKRKVGASYNLMMDDLLPAFIYVVVRASVLQLGSEINFIKDFIQDSRLEHGKFDFAFTTLTGSYHYILHEKMTNE